jgi:heme/copper-type cytochrome/quinol oxidase subunit 2
MPIAVRVVKPEIFDQWAALMKDRKRGPARQLIEKAAIEQPTGMVAADTAKPLAIAGN